MQNFDLLREVGKTRKPVLLKRGLAATVKDWLLSRRVRAEPGQPRRDPVRARDQDVRGLHPLHDGHQLDPGRAAVERTCRSSSTRATPPGSATTSPRWRWRAWRRARTAIIVEVHYYPAEAQCDGPQALLPEMFKELMGQLRQIAAIHKKEFAEVGEAVDCVKLNRRGARRDADQRL